TLIGPAADRRVLLTGGTPRFDQSFNPGCVDCVNDQGFTCALDQVAVVDASATPTVRPACPSTIPALTCTPDLSAKLKIPRFGHSQTVLADGRVLLVGGLT